MDKNRPKNSADPWLIWLASVLSAATFIVYITHI